MDRIRTVSRVFRYLVIAIGTLIVIAIGIALLAGGQAWLSIGDERLASLMQAGAITATTAMALLAPVAAIFILGIYWLQRLFGAYAAGKFFTDDTMACYLWLVWLKVASFVYQLVLPLLLNWLATPASSPDGPDVIIDVSSLVELIVLLLIVHILREAQRISEENESFV